MFKITREEFVRRQRDLINLHVNYTDQLKTDSSNVEALISMNKEINAETEFLSQVFVED